MQVVHVRFSRTDAWRSLTAGIVAIVMFTFVGALTGSSSKMAVSAGLGGVISLPFVLCFPYRSVWLLDSESAAIWVRQTYLAIPIRHRPIVILDPAAVAKARVEAAPQTRRMKWRALVVIGEQRLVLGLYSLRDNAETVAARAARRIQSARK